MFLSRMATDRLVLSHVIRRYNWNIVQCGVKHDNSNPWHPSFVLRRPSWLAFHILNFCKP